MRLGCKKRYRAWLVFEVCSMNRLPCTGVRERSQLYCSEPFGGREAQEIILGYSTSSHQSCNLRLFVEYFNTHYPPQSFKAALLS